MAPLIEVVHQFDEARLRQNVSDNLSARVLGLIQFQVEFSHQYQILAPEAFQGFLDTWEVGQRSQWEVRSNEQGPGRASDYLTAYHVRTMEVRKLENKSCWPVP